MLGKIPQNRLYGLGLNILKLYPEPNTQGLNYNLETVAPEVNEQHVTSTWSAWTTRRRRSCG